MKLQGLCINLSRDRPFTPLKSRCDCSIQEYCVTAGEKEREKAEPSDNFEGQSQSQGFETRFLGFRFFLQSVAQDFRQQSRALALLWQAKGHNCSY